MHKYVVLCLMSASLLNGMDPRWFYDEHCPYSSANKLHQQCKWQEAETEYYRLLHEHAGDERDQIKARINLAACQMAQRRKLINCTAFDDVCQIPRDKRFAYKNTNGLVAVRTDSISNGDIAHFLPALIALKSHPGITGVLLAMRKTMHAVLADTAAQLGAEMVDEQDQVRLGQADCITHLVSLLGHLQLYANELRMSTPLYTAELKARLQLEVALAPKLAEKKRLGIVFLGDNRVVTCLGGKQIPHDSGMHGRQLNAHAFEQLLTNNPQLLLVDANPPKSAIQFTLAFTSEDESDSDLKGLPQKHALMFAKFRSRVVRVPDETTPFDTTIALAHIMNEHPDRVIGFAADSSCAHVFARALGIRAQRRFAYIIPNPDEYDAHMEVAANGDEQMLSHCPVFKCTSPKKQAETICEAYKGITSEPRD